MTRILIIDNYDSFTYNLAQQLGELGATVEVVRNDAVGVDDVLDDPPDGIVVSPGPGTPDSDSGISLELIAAVAGQVPVLGVCLGHQCIGQLYGGRVVRAPALVHGKASAIHHLGTGVFRGLPDGFPATRYHSLVVDAASVPAVLEVTARTADGLVMGLRHRELAVEGVQFHPESILTTAGMTLLATFLSGCGHTPSAVPTSAAG